jgi:hypothetical protein
MGRRGVSRDRSMRGTRAAQPSHFNPGSHPTPNHREGTPVRWDVMKERTTTQRICGGGASVVATDRPRRELVD